MAVGLICILVTLQHTGHLSDLFKMIWQAGELYIDGLPSIIWGSAAEHILTSYDFSTTEGINDYLRQIPDFVADSGGVIQDETEITPPLLTLSTCTRNDKQKRCLVQGILVECEKKNQEE